MRYGAVWLTALLLAGNGCSRESNQDKPAQKVVEEAGPPKDWKTTKTPPSVPKGMVWIPPGALVAGTLPERLPRKADQEMPGEQVVLNGFFIDQFAFPNEHGGIPRTNVTQAEARALCTEAGKRLCSELEWERACKGPNNYVYEYGDRFVASTCKMGNSPRPLPSGYLFGCNSEFGVYDLHGGVWEWTDSPWGRGTNTDQVTLRGGNGSEGEVVGRCANAKPYSPKQKAHHLGFRCCSGPRNEAEVSLHIESGPPLKRLVRIDRDLASALEARLPPEEAVEMTKRGIFRVVRLWEWRPLANEDLLVAGGCAGGPPHRRCGVLLVRRTLGRLDVLDWASSGHFIPTVKLKHNPRLLWVYGGDRRSHYRRPLTFEWGKVSVGEEERNTREAND